MANHKATKKDVRQAAKRRERNKYYGKTTRNAIRDLKAVTGKEAGEKLPLVASMIDKLAKRGVIHKNKAANLKRKLTKQITIAKKQFGLWDLWFKILLVRHDYLWEHWME